MIKALRCFFSWPLGHEWTRWYPVSKEPAWEFLVCRECGVTRYRERRP